MLKSIYVWLFLLMLIPVINNAQEVIDIGVDKRDININQEITFSANSQSELFESDSIIIWDLGDGNQAEGEEISYQYNDVGEYIVNVFILNDEEEYQDFIIINVIDNNVNNAHGGIVSNDTKIIINELLPNPNGSDEDNEWIELKNIGSSVVDINNWIISDASNKQVKLTQEKFGDLTIDSNSFLILKRPDTKISLNNSGDTINLIDQNSKNIDSVSYEKSSEGKSWARDLNNNWYWANTPSPGSENINNQSEELETVTTTKLINVDMKKDKQEKVLGYTANKEDYKNLKISEVFPNPKGDDRQYEFIEIVNLSENDKDVSDWYLTDEKKYYYFPANTIINSHDFLLINRSESGIALNNSNETLQLYSNTEERIDEINYEKSYEEKSYSRTEDGEWFWTESITPGEENEFTFERKELETGYLYLNTISEIDELEKGTKVVVQGITTVGPDVFGKQFFYMQDSFSGIQVYMNKAIWPEIKPGYILEIKGVVSESYNEKRINTKNIKDIILINIGPEVELNTIFELDESQVGLLLNFQTQIIEKNSNNWIVELEDEVKLVFKFKNDKLSDFLEGDIIEVSGILRKRNEDLRIYPRSIEDIVLIKRGQELHAQEEIEKEPFGAQIDKNYNKWIIAYTIIVGIIIILLGRLYLIKKLTIKTDPHGR